MPDDRTMAGWPVGTPPLAGTDPLIDVHAHFFHEGCGRSDWREVNAARIRAGERIGITCHVASILGTWGHRSPVYFPSLQDVEEGNDAMLRMQGELGARVRGYAVVNPNFTSHSLAEIERCRDAGAVGVKLLASRRAADPLLSDIALLASELGLPILHHAWQNRTRHWPQQDASDATDIVRLAEKHPRLNVILAHIGGGGDYSHTFHVVRDQKNVFLDLSGSGTDRGMLDRALEAVGPGRLLWACDVTMETGLAKLRALQVLGLSQSDMSDIRWRNAARIFPRGAFPDIVGSEVTA